jgi:hypothetical protein
MSTNRVQLPNYPFIQSKLSSPLDFWKNYEKLLPELAVLAKKFLSVQASSASCERMFSIAGHIFQCKRRRMSHSLFCALVFLKLNDTFLFDILFKITTLK